MQTVKVIQYNEKMLNCKSHRNFKKSFIVEFKSRSFEFACSPFIKFPRSFLGNGVFPVSNLTFSYELHFFVHCCHGFINFCFLILEQDWLQIDCWVFLHFIELQVIAHFIDVIFRDSIDLEKICAFSYD